MNYQGTIYRPWMEGDSLLIQVTLGCSHNRCTFCNMFREKPFRMRKLEEVFADIEEARRRYRRVDSIFLIDGNALALKAEMLLQVIEKVKATFPECRRVSLYGSLVDFGRKSVDWWFSSKTPRSADRGLF